MTAAKVPVKRLCPAWQRPCMPVLAVLVLLASACAGTPPAERLAAGTARLEAELAALEQQGFVGQVAVVHAGEPLLIGGYGTMGVDDPRPVTAKAVLPLASLTKPFTASAVLALAADGRLGLDDPAGRYLPELDKDWAALTVAQLLTHSAGLPAEIHNRNWPGDPRFEPIDQRELIRRVNHFAPDSPPGQRFNYGNVAYNLLAVIIERVSGQPWEQFLRERLLKPAGAEGIGLLEPDWPADLLVHGRAEGTDRGHYLDRPRLDDGLGYNLRGAGDLLARPGALVDWHRALRAGTWLPEPWQDRWLKPRLNDPDGGRYGYGLHFRVGRFGTVVGHRGGDRVFATDFSWFIDADTMVYIATADARLQADVLAARLHRLLLGP